MGRALKGHQPSSWARICSALRNQRSTAKATHVHVSDQSVTASLHEGVPWNLFPIWLVLYGLVLTVQERKRSFDALRKN